MSCFGIHISKNKQIVILLLGILAVVGLGILPFQLSIYSYAKSVPIQLGYDEAQEYWMLSSVMAEATEEVDADSQAQAESEVGLLFDPLLPISETNLEVANWEFKRNLIHWMKAPAYDINDAGWLTTARYKVGLYKNTAKLTEQAVNINYKEPRIISSN